MDNTSLQRDVKKLLDFNIRIVVSCLLILTTLTACSWQQIVGKEYVRSYSYVEGDRCHTPELAVKAAKVYLSENNMRWREPIEVVDRELDHHQVREWMLIYRTPYYEAPIMGVRRLDVLKNSCFVTEPPRL